MGKGVHKFNGKPVEDASVGMTVTVTNRDVAKAKGNHPDSCAAAVAICREQHAAEAHVHVSRTYVLHEKTAKNYKRYLTPPSLAREIVALDRGGTFAPGDYILKPPSKHHQLGKGYGSSTNKAKKGGKPRNPQHVTVSIRHRAP